MLHETPARCPHEGGLASIEFEGKNLSMTWNANILTTPVGGGHSCLSRSAKPWRSVSSWRKAESNTQLKISAMFNRGCSQLRTACVSTLLRSGGGSLLNTRVCGVLSRATGSRPVCTTPLARRVHPGAAPVARFLIPFTHNPQLKRGEA